MNTGGQPRTAAAPGACVFLKPAWTRLPEQTRLPAAAAVTHKCCLSDLAGISPEVQLHEETGNESQNGLSQGGSMSDRLLPNSSGLFIIFVSFEEKLNLTLPAAVE